MGGDYKSTVAFKEETHGLQCYLRHSISGKYHKLQVTRASPQLTIACENVLHVYGINRCVTYEATRKYSMNKKIRLRTIKYATMMFPSSRVFDGRLVRHTNATYTADDVNGNNMFSFLFVAKYYLVPLSL